MAISVGDAYVKLGLNTTSFDKGMQGLKGQIQKHSRAIGMAMTAAGGAILAAGALSVKTYAQMGDEVQKMALRTGFSTEALSELRHAAEISGASLSTLEKGVKRMSGTILDAQDGLETYIRAFRHIGIEMKELDGLDPEEQFFRIAEGISQLEDPTTRAAIAQDMFGRAGTELLPLFAQGTEGIAALREEAHELGIVFDQEAADKAANFTDAMHRLSEATSGVKMAIAENLIPILMPLIDKIKEAISGMTEWAKEHPGLTKAIVILTGVLAGLLLVLGPLMIMLPGMPMLIHGVTAAVSKLTLAAFGLNMALAPFLLLIGAGLAGALMVIIPLMTHWESITNDIKNLWGTMATFFKGVGDKIADAFQSVIDRVLEMWGLLQQFWAWLTGLFGGGKRGVPAVRRREPWEKEFWEYGEPANVGFPIGGAVAGMGGVVQSAGITPGFQYGGLITKPTLAMLGEHNTKEAVIPLNENIPMENVVKNYVYLDGELVGQSVNRSLGSAYMRRERMGG